MKPDKMISCDVLVIGGGIAAFFAAIKAREQGAQVLMVDKGYAGRSGQSPYADSFMVFNPEWGHDLQKSMDSVNRTSEYLNNRFWTELILRRSYDRFQDLVEWGCSFMERPDGTVMQMPAAVPGVQSAVQFDNRKTPYGMVLRAKALKVGVKIIDDMMVSELLRHNGSVVGAVGFSRYCCETSVFIAKKTILCVGGCGFKPLGYPALAQLTCDGEAMAYRAGAEIVGKEFVDTHFSKRDLPDPVSQRRGDAAPPPPPKDNKEEKPKMDFGTKYNALGEVISDRPEGVSEYMFAYLQAECEIHRGQGPIINRGSEICGGSALGMSLRKADGLWPAGEDCASNIGGLFAAGDALGNMQNGACYSERGSSTAGCAVTGTIAGETAAAQALQMPMPEVPEQEIRRACAYILAPAERKGGYSPRWVISLLHNTMMPYFVSYIKKEDRLQAVLTLVMFMKEHLAPMIVANDAHELRLAHEAKNMILSAEMRLRSALFRTESRGNHYREDYPFRDDDNWFAWTVIREEQGEMQLKKVPIPEDWRPDKALTYREKYPLELMGENAWLRRKTDISTERGDSDGN